MENILRIPIVSRNFTPRCFYNRHQEKYWDILCIARAHKLKNLDLFFKSIRKIYDLGYNFKVLLISPQNRNEDQKKFYTSLMDNYYKLFSYDEPSSTI